MDIQLLLIDKKYSDYCRYISNNSSQWQDLYQEFRLEILTSFKKRDIKVNAENYCKGIIYNLWRHMTGYGHATKNQAMLLANYADKSVEITENLFNQPQQIDRTDFEYELNTLLNSENRTIKKQAAIFKECINGSSRADISRDLQINYRIVHEAVEQTTIKIKTNMTKNEIKERLLAEGINSGYSGKDKTFYTDKKPSQELETKIIKAGFKQCKKS